MPGVQELVVILLIVIVLFGATRLPQLGKGLGEGISNFKRGLKSRSDKADPDHADVDGSDSSTDS